MIDDHVESRIDVLLAEIDRLRAEDAAIRELYEDEKAGGDLMTEQLRWALAKVDRLTAEAIDAAILCRRSDAFLREIGRLKAELAAAKAEIDHLAAAIEPSRPEAIVRLPGGRWHLFEDSIDADRFVSVCKAESYALDAWNVSEWTWHPRGG